MSALAVVGPLAIVFLGRIWGWAWSPATVTLSAIAVWLLLALVGSGLFRAVMLFVVSFQVIFLLAPGRGVWLFPLVFLIIFAVLLRWRIGEAIKTDITARDDQGVDPEAQWAFDRFVQYGFETIASADVSGPNFRTVFTYLVSTDLRTYAVATVKLQCLVSRFGDRLLVSIDRASLPTLPSHLRQLVKWQRLIDLVQAHNRALEVLAGLGHEPDLLDREPLLESALAHERESMAFIATRPWWTIGQELLGKLRRRPPNSALITDDPESVRRIEEWAAS
jgi:hypothetical protein